MLGFRRGRLAGRVFLESPPEHRHGLERKMGQSAHNATPAMQPPVPAAPATEITTCRVRHLAFASGVRTRESCAVGLCGTAKIFAVWGKSTRKLVCEALLTQVCESTASFRESCFKAVSSRTQVCVDHRIMLSGASSLSERGDSAALCTKRQLARGRRSHRSTLPLTECRT